jgi:hypothetical protein
MHSASAFSFSMKQLASDAMCLRWNSMKMKSLRAGDAITIPG